MGTTRMQSVHCRYPDDVGQRTEVRKPLTMVMSIWKLL